MRIANCQLAFPFRTLAIISRELICCVLSTGNPEIPEDQLFGICNGIWPGTRIFHIGLHAVEHLPLA